MGNNNHSRRSNSTKSTCSSSSSLSSNSNSNNRNSQRGPSKKKNSGRKAEHNDDDKAFRLQVESDGKRIIHDMVGDGNCLFRSLSDQLFGDYGHRYHSVIREVICDYMDRHKESFQQFLVLGEEQQPTHDGDADATSFEQYVQQMRHDGEWGGNVELVAASRLFQRNILVYHSNGAFLIDSPADTTTKATTPFCDKKGEDLILSYHDNDHYNSVWIVGRKAMLIQPQELPIVDDDGVVNKKKRENRFSSQMMAEEETLTSSSKDSKNECNSLKSQDEMLLNNSEEKHTNKETIVPKRNDTCTCGSGLKYKKCCLARQKQQVRLKKWKQKHGQQDITTTRISCEEDDEEESIITLDGGFKVLKI